MVVEDTGGRKLENGLGIQLSRQKYFCTNNSVKAGNDIIDIFTSEDMENTSLQSWM